MARDTEGDILRPSVLDRLIQAPGSSSSFEAINAADLRRAVARDLERLLNTRIWWPWENLARLEEARESILTYGIPELSAYSWTSPKDARTMGGLIEEVVRRFEPRLIPRSVKAEVRTSEALDDFSLRIRIEAILPGERITAITAPTLILHARDDTLQLFRNAEFAAARIPGATLVSFLGLWDDRWPTSPPAKLLWQSAAAIVVVMAGVKIQMFGSQAVDLSVSLIWILAVTNAFNLLDNMDGLAAGVASIAASFFLGLAAYNGQYLVGALAAALLGACLGFLLFNFNPARIFMGDAGSLFIGFVMAALAIKMRFPGQTLAVSWMVPILVLAVPLADTAYVTVARLRRGDPFWRGGKDHLSHRLVTLGASHRRAVALLYAAGTLLGLAGVAVSILAPLPARILAGALTLASVAGCTWLDSAARRHQLFPGADGPE